MQLALVTVLVLGHVMSLALALLVGMPLWNPGGTLSQLAVAEALPLGVGDPFQVAHLRASVCFPALYYHKCFDIDSIYCMQLHQSAAMHGSHRKRWYPAFLRLLSKEMQPMAIGCVVMLQGLLMLLVLTTDGVLTIHTHLHLVTTHMQ